MEGILQVEIKVRRVMHAQKWQLIMRWPVLLSMCGIEIMQCYELP